MKNLLAITVFSLIAFSVSLMKTEPKVKIDIPSVIRSGKITMLVNKRNLLYENVSCLVEKNKMQIDSLKNR